MVKSIWISESNHKFFSFVPKPKPPIIETMIGGCFALLSNSSEKVHIILVNAFLASVCIKI